MPNQTTYVTHRHRNPPPVIQSCDLRYLTTKVINYRILGTGDRIASINRNPQGRTGPDALNRTSTADQTLRRDLVNIPRVSGPLGMNVMDSSQLHRDILKILVRCMTSERCSAGSWIEALLKFKLGWKFTYITEADLMQGTYVVSRGN